MFCSNNYALKNLDEGLENNAALNWKIIKKDPEIKINQMWFAKALTYIIKGQNFGNGQGDVDEGLFARLKTNNPLCKNIREFLHIKYGKSQIIERTKNEFVDFFIRPHLFIPIACFYSSRLSWFENQDKYEVIDGKINEEIILSGRIFRDFLDTANSGIKVRFSDLEIINYGILKNLDKILINNTFNIDIQGTSVLGKINYQRKDNLEWILPEFLRNPHDDFPAELFYKNHDFSYQLEMRTLILCNKKIYNEGHCFWNNNFHKPLVTQTDKNFYLTSSHFNTPFKMQDIEVDGKDITLKFQIFVMEQ